jgi:hypothetical protein
MALYEDVTLGTVLAKKLNLNGVDMNSTNLSGVTASSDELNVLDGATATAAEISLNHGAPANITFAIAAGTANVSEVTCTVKDAAGSTLAGVFNFDLWLSDAATGAGLTGSTASGAVTAKAASGAVVGTYAAKQALRVQTLATGVFILSITDTNKAHFYVAAMVPGATGKVVVSTQLASGSYGA